MKTYIFFFLFTSSFSAQADIKKLSIEFLSRNFKIYQSQKQIEFTKLNLDLDASSRSWGTNFSGAYSDDSTDGLTSLTSTGTTTKVYSADISKSFLWGGSFSLENDYESYEGGTFFATPKYGFGQTLSYSQRLGANLLGRQDFLNRNILKSEVQVSELKNSKLTEDLFLAFAADYVDTALAKSLVDLQADALRRSRKRLNLIRKWTRDGIREKVDLYRAELTEIQAQESAKQSQMNLLDRLESLSLKIHRKILAIDIAKLRDDVFERPTGNFDSNKQNVLVKKEFTVLEDRLKKSKMGFLPDVTLSSSYETNAYDTESSNVMGDGNVGGDNNAFSISLNVTVPLGFEGQKVEKEKSSIQAMMKRKELEVIGLNFIQSEMSLVKQFQMNRDSILLSKKRLSIAKKSLREFNRLYSKGRSTLENVIRAEEDLIHTERSYINYLAINKKLVFKMAHLYGSLKEYLFTQYEEKGEK